MKRLRGLPNHPGSLLLFTIIIVLTLIETIGIIGQAISLATAIAALFEGATVSSQINTIILFFILFMLRHIISFIKRSIAERHASTTATRLRKQLLQQVSKLGQAYIAKEGTGKTVTLAIEGIQNIQTYVHITIPRMIESIIIPAGIVIYVWTVHPSSAYILVGVIPVIVIFMILLGLAAQKLADRQYASYRMLSNHFIDSLQGLETLTFLGQSKQHGKKIARVSKQYRKATMRTLRMAFSSSFALDFFTSLAIAFVAVGLGFNLIEGTMILLPALTILILAPEYFLPIRQVGMDYHATLDGQVALQEVENLIQQAERVPYVEDLDKTMLWDEQKFISFQDISVSIDEHSILKNVDFSYKGTGMIGLVGPSGSGKTSLLHVLAGSLQPENGVIQVGNTKVPHLHRSSWLHQIAYIPQRPYIFPLSIADNIRFYKPNATDHEVNAVVQQIGLGNLVQSLSHGIHELIGEGGRALSGGQEQRIAIARAMLSDRSIILLDEPTAHLDVETEYELKDILLQLFANKLVFFATHRMHWLKQMDHLLMIKDGTIVESGTYEHLQTKETGAFHTLTETMKQRSDHL